MMLNPDCLQGYDFLGKFIPLFEGMIDLGLTEKQALKAVCMQKFVQDFIDTPEWFVSAKKIPNGYKWCNGEKYHQKGAGKCDAETYTFLAVENDLYIKGIFAGMEYIFKDEDGKIKFAKIPKKLIGKICIIKDWKSIRPQEITYRLNLTPFFENSYYDFCHKNGVSLSMVTPALKEWENDT